MKCLTTPRRMKIWSCWNGDSENHVTALRTDVIAIGQIKARLVNGLFERLEDLEQTTIEVPLGTVFAPNYFTGMGPSVDIGMAGLTQMSAEFISAFSSAGINQTRHNIIIEIHAGFRIPTPFGGEDRGIVTSYPVTDTVIVGTVPERYAYIDDLGGNLLGQVSITAARQRAEAGRSFRIIRRKTENNTSETAQNLVYYILYWIKKGCWHGRG